MLFVEMSVEKFPSLPATAVTCDEQYYTTIDTSPWRNQDWQRESTRVMLPQKEQDLLDQMLRRWYVERDEMVTFMVLCIRSSSVLFDRNINLMDYLWLLHSACSRHLPFSIVKLMIYSHLILTWLFFSATGRICKNQNVSFDCPRGCWPVPVRAPHPGYDQDWRFGCRQAHLQVRQETSRFPQACPGQA